MTSARNGARSGGSLLALVPLAATLLFVLAFGVDVPYHDEWNMVEGIGRAFDDSVSLKDLWALHNEHVAFFDHVAIVSVALLSRWNLRALMLTTVGVTSIAAIFLAWALRRSGAPPWSIALASCFLFSLHAMDNWLWGGQIQLALTVVGTVGALSLLGADAPRPFTLAAAAALGLVGTWSFLAGFLVWPVGAGMLLLRRFQDRRARFRALSVWLLGAAVAIGVPLVVYSGLWLGSNARGASWSTIADFVASYLGAGLIGPTTHAWLARAVGWSGLAVLGCASLWSAARRRDSPATLSLLSIGIFGLLTGCMIALGRMTATVTQTATTSRYTCFSGLAWIVIALAPWLASTAPRSPRRRTAAVVFSVVIVSVLAGTETWRIADARELAARRSAASQALRTGEGMSIETLKGAVGDPEAWLPLLHDRLAILRRLRLSLFRHASAEELHPAPLTGPFAATLSLREVDGRRAGSAEIRGGVPGNVAIAVFTRDGVPATTEMTLDASGSATTAIDLGPPPVPGNAVFTVFTLDREGRIVQSAPATVPR